MMKTPSRPAAKRSADGGPVTLEMVAQTAGVSPSTVSRILNGTATVSAEKQAAVQSAIERLGFRPNPVARGLAGGRTLSIGVLTQTISSPFYGEALHGIEDELDEARAARGAGRVLRLRYRDGGVRRARTHAARALRPRRPPTRASTGPSSPPPR
jgi:transcriptional regulator with XRE-family HTH domain